MLLVWSYILDYENAANPYTIRKTSIREWKNRAVAFITENEELLVKAEELTACKLKAKDALHIACAMYANCRYFLTTDDGIIEKSDAVEGIKVMNPVDILKILED